MHLTLDAVDIGSSVGQAHLLHLLLQLILYVLDICIQIVYLNLEIYVNGWACLIWCFVEVFALLAFHVVVG